MAVGVVEHAQEVHGHCPKVEEDEPTKKITQYRDVDDQVLLTEVVQTKQKHEDDAGCDILEGNTKDGAGDCDWIESRKVVEYRHRGQCHWIVQGAGQNEHSK
jgi:hypothetical protein